MSCYTETSQLSCTAIQLVSVYWNVNVQKQPPEGVYKRLFLKILQCSLENTCVESLFNKVADLQVCNFITKILWHICFSMNIKRFLKTSIFKNFCERLLLDFVNNTKDVRQLRQ